MPRLHLSPFIRGREEIPKRFSLHLFRRIPCQLLRGAIELKDTPCPVQHDDQQVPSRIQNCRDELLFPLLLLMDLLQVVHIHEHDQGAIDLAVRRQERKDADGIPAAVVGLDLAPYIAYSLVDLRRSIHPGPEG